MKPSVYLETTVISYLVGRVSTRDLVVAANQEITREWWSERRTDFNLFASALVVGEARDGNVEIASKRVELLQGVDLLEVSAPAYQLAEALLGKAGIPSKARVDALHIAIASVHGIDYLLTWNCKHIANAVTLPKVYAVCKGKGYAPPFVCTPQELMEG